VSIYLSSKNFPCDSVQESQALDNKLATLMQSDYDGDFYALLAQYQRVLADNKRRLDWPAIHDKLSTLFKCGRAVPLDGPMVGIPVSIRDSDFFHKIAERFGHERSVIAAIEVMATAWNATFADTGLWMGKTFEPVLHEVVREKCHDNPKMMAAYDENITRIGRNYFREPASPNLVQALGLPTLNVAWHLKERPMSPDATGFDGTLLHQNLMKEKLIPYSKTGGIFLANMDRSVVPEMHGKQVYSLNYRWPNLHPAFPMTCLVDEIVQVDEGIYLGQLVFATKHFSIGAIDLPFIPGSHNIELGEPYAPGSHEDSPDYGYQNNGFFLMMDPAYAKRIYADTAFPQLRPRPSESGYKELGYDQQTVVKMQPGTAFDWACGWSNEIRLRQKFTTMITTSSPKDDDGDVHELLHDGESVLQMLQRISSNISAQTNPEDKLKYFEPLHRLFRAGVAPDVQNGLFQGAGTRGYNVRVEGSEQHDWYGEKEISQGFDYYHGATLNLHCGFADIFRPDIEAVIAEAQLIPGVLSSQLTFDEVASPNVMNMVWHNIGKYIFPWAGKSFEKISPRKLSMLLDESADLAERYPARVDELKHHLASAPHYIAVKKDAENYWQCPGRYAPHLERSWDQGMRDADKAFWQSEANDRWVMGYNLQDKRILAADALMKLADMNYREPDTVLQKTSEASGSPFQRQGYAFLGVAGQESILPMNSSDENKKRVFQFHYRYPMIGGPAPIGYCLDELVEIADGLFLGQLIYSTALHLPFHSGVDTGKYAYQLFGYFLLLDDEWEHHRQAIGLDTLN
jgi:hypothetical protein